MVFVCANLFLTGFISGMGPCVASCGPVLGSYFAASGQPVSRCIIDYTVFSLSRIAAYAVIAVAVFFLGNSLVEKYIQGMAVPLGVCTALVIVVIGITVLKGTAFVSCPRIRSRRMLVTGLLMGAAPCAPLLGVLAYIAMVAKSWGQSLGYAVVFGLGSILSPLLLLSVCTAGVGRFFSIKYEKIFFCIRITCGIVLLLFGIHLLWKQVYQ